MRNMIDHILAGYGSPVTILRAGGSRTEVRAFLQPGKERDWQSIRSVQALGEIPQGSCIYIGPAEAPLAAGEQVAQGQEKYLVMQAQTLVVAGEELYIWALLRRHRGEEPWNN